MKRLFLNSFLILISLSLSLPARAEQQPIAVLNGRPIMSQDVESRAATKLYRLRWEIYNTLKAEAQALVDERLLSDEAERRGLSVDELLKQEVEKKAKPATEADIDAYIKEHDIKDTGEDARNRIRTYLTDRDRIQCKLDLLEQLRQQANYQFLLTEPERPRMRVPIGDDDPSRGPPDAPVTIIHFASFSCEHCAESSRKIQRLTEEFPGEIRWVHRNFLNMFDERGLMAAEAGETARLQGKFWEFHDRMYSLSGEFSEDDLKQILADIGVDPAQFETSRKEASYIMAIKKDIEDGVAAGVTSVPALFINGRYISGTFPYEKLKEMVEEELKAVSPEQKKVSGPVEKSDAGG